MDKNCSVSPGVAIGHDPVRDAERFPFISGAGVVVLPKGTHVPRTGPIQFAPDVARLLRGDPTTSAKLLQFEGRALVEAGDRLGDLSVGPRRMRTGSPSHGEERRP